ncbi:MAG: hypothetical protein R5N72_03550, partial [Cutibacterium granulosum]|nr:hypothetical protein [Cutibacterium granulosum]
MYVDKKLAGVKAVQTLSRLNRTAPGKEDTFVLDFANTAEEIQKAFQHFYEETVAEKTDPNTLYNLSGDLWAAQVLSEPEMDAAVTALLSDDPARQGEVYRNLEFAKDRWTNLDDEEAEEFRAKLNHFCRAYSFLSQVMAFIDFVSDTWKEFRAEHEGLGRAMWALLAAGLVVRRALHDPTTASLSPRHTCHGVAIAAYGSLGYVPVAGVVGRWRAAAR